jgi:hypothetical protein
MTLGLTRWFSGCKFELLGHILGRAKLWEALASHFGTFAVSFLHLIA